MAHQEVTRQTQAAEPVQQPAPRQVAPGVDIFENDQELLLVADLPGVDPSGLRVSLDPPELHIEGRSSFDEREPITYARTFRVDDRIDPDGISAALVSGVLRVRLKKSAALRPRRIEVRSS